MKTYLYPYEGADQQVSIWMWPHSQINRAYQRERIGPYKIDAHPIAGDLIRGCGSR
jgi:hypothetical protein